MKIAAIYTRKSKFTGKGESIQNQIQVCKDYLNRFAEDYEFLIYEDEGFSGKNTERPQFKKMFRDAKAKKFNVLICYRLDRISRNIADFASLIQDLEKYSISFISVNEQFDTSTPMGRAMMYIASVFAQLERETIAERIRDNMLELAKTGRWLGGCTPTGYESVPITYFDAEMNEKKMYKLSPIKEELDIVKLIFDKYLETQSLSAVTKYLLSHNIKTKLNTDWNYSKVKSVLISPVYVQATKKTLEYIQSQNITVVGKPDGVHGFLSYNKKKDKTGPYRDPSEWIYAIGCHEGIISSEDWIKVQELLSINKSKAPILGKSNTALLTGIIRCSKCGGIMRIAYGSVTKSGKRNYYYACGLKYASGSTRCNNKNVRGDVLDDLIIKKLKFLCTDKGKLISELKKQKYSLDEQDKLNKKSTLDITESINKNNTSIQNLLNTLSQTEDKNISNLLLEKIENLNNENKLLEKKLKQQKEFNNSIKDEDKNIDILVNSLRSFEETAATCTFEERKLLIKSIVEKVYWNGDTRELDVKLWGSG